MIYTYKYKLQGDGLNSWVQTITNEGEETSIDLVYFITVDNWKLKAVLSLNGLLEQVETALNSLPEPDKTTANFAWNFAPTIDSNSKTTLLVQSVLGLSLTEMIDLFIQAKNFSI